MIRFSRALGCRSIQPSMSRTSTCIERWCAARTDHMLETQPLPTEIPVEFRKSAFLVGWRKLRSFSPLGRLQNLSEGHARNSRIRFQPLGVILDDFRVYLKNRYGFSYAAHGDLVG